MIAQRFSRLEALLRGAQRQDRLRHLEGPVGHDFSSNDYLGLAQDSRLAQAVQDAIHRGVAIGAGGSRLLRGNHPEHQALESEAAAFFNVQRCLLFGSGFAANTALLSTLPARADLVVYDELVHASMHDGMRGGRAQTVAVAHNDADAVEEAIRDWRARGGTGTPWIAVESLYSMDGDCADLDALIAIADRHDGFLIVDEAHATGIFGQGRGLAAHLHGRDNLIAVHTGGKALGVSGALVSADPRVIDALINRARPFIYATAPSPLTASALRAALRVVATDPQRIQTLHQRMQLANTLLQQRLNVRPSNTQIVPVILGRSAQAMDVAAHMRANGFDIRAIRPPTVPEGTARLRISITNNVTADTITAMVECLAECERAAA